ncbi:MAG: prephenate dehydrogenase/arogenate dehydrogenase family protein [Anaerolineaceae bacterium]|nr:prephenate dehydrogenase/arogenate dehydrogenase family protein [Anaerolineaceae bacterium]
MAINIAVIGLRQLGISAAMALSEKDDCIQLIGWDPDADTWPAAKQQGVFQSIKKSMRSALKDARMVILSLSPDDLLKNAEEFKKLNSQRMIVINITNLHDLSAKWMEKYLTDSTRYVSLLPTMNPALVLSNDFDLVRPHADLFKGGLIYIIDSLGVEKAALDLAIDVSVLLGGKPILADPVEIDGLISANLLLPQIGAAAVMLAAAEQPSWRDGQRIAGRALANSTNPLKDASVAGDISQTIYYQRDHLVRLTNDLIKKLIEFRELIGGSDSEMLEEKMRTVVNLRESWIAERSAPISAHEFTSSFPNQKQALKRFLNLNTV